MVECTCQEDKRYEAEGMVVDMVRKMAYSHEE